MTEPHKPATQTPTANAGVRTPTGSSQQKASRNAQQVAMIALNMSWQLLIVVVAPILAGHWLDKHYHKASLWTFIGLIVSVAGMIAVVIQTNRQINEYMQTNTKKDTDK